MKKLIAILSSLAILMAFQNCSDVGFTDASGGGVCPTNDPNCGFVVPGPTPTPGMNSLNDGLISHTQPAAVMVSKVDILFVTDTSGSLDAERQQIADSLDQFVANIPAGIDYNVGVVLAHGPNSSNSGRLYRKDNEDRVLQSSQMTLNQIRSALRDKLTNPSTDNATDGGEVGMYSLQRLMDPANLAAAQSLNFFRNDAALAVVFVADENDICAIYPPGITPVRDVNDTEPGVKAGLCVDNNITHQTTYNKLLAVKNGLPLTITGVLYTDPTKVPVGRNVEDEVGYGYLDLIALNGNSAAELTGDIAAGLGDLGALVSASLQIRTRFAIANPAITDCAGQVQASSIVARVDGVTVPHSFSAATCEVTLAAANAGNALSQVQIEYQYWTFPM